MRGFFCAVILVLFTQIAFGQDGGNMHYIKPDLLTAEHIGKFVHLDFGSRSFAFHDFDRKRPLDIVPIELNGKKANFIEHRVDDGYNNWFRDQYLESVESIEGKKIRMVKSKLLESKGDSIKVESYFETFDKDGVAVTGTAFNRTLVFKKKDLSEVLVYTK